ncbi:MAG: PilN domain-containing protein [Burkholderiales bacterium]|nr:PilN domain-containing protein [Burkholderiales bacterium]
MIRINLLPHRERKREALRRQIAILAGMTAGLGLVIIFAVHVAINSRIDYQNERNNYLKQQIAILDHQIEDIRKLKEQTRALLARKQVVEKLQDNRAEAVHLMDQLAKRVPEGIYLRSLQEESQGKITKIHLTGYAQSNARVSTLMRSLDDSQWMASPSLVEIHSVTVNSQRLSEFSLFLNLTHKAAAAANAPKN